MFESAVVSEPSRNQVTAFLGRFFGVALEGRSYLNLLYLWLAFPLGIFYFVLLVTGFSVGIGLTIIWIGLGILFVLMLAIWALEGMERVLAVGLLGADVPERLPAAPAPGFRAWVKAVFSSVALWKGVAFLFIKFPLGLAGWVTSVVAISVSMAFALSPFAYWFGGEVELEGWIFDGPAGVVLLSLTGVLMLFLTLHLHNGMAWVWKKLAETMLGEGARSAAVA